MKIKSLATTKCLTIVLLMVVFSASNVHSTKPRVPPILPSACEPLEKLNIGLPIPFLLTYEPGERYAKDIQSADVIAKIKGGLQYDGPLSWHYDFSVQPVCSVFFELTIPKNDTSVLEFSFDLGKYSWGVFRTFISTEDTVAFYHGDITVGPGFRKPVQKHFGVQYPPPTDLEGNPLDRPMTQEEWLHHKMKYSENSPLTDADAQQILVDGKLNVRYRGETKFRPFDSTKITTVMYPDGFNSVNFRHFLILDLSDAAMRDSVESMVDTLYPTNDPDVFKVLVGVELLKRIDELGVPIKKQLRGQ